MRHDVLRNHLQRLEGIVEHANRQVGDPTLLHLPETFDFMIDCIQAAG